MPRVVIPLSPGELQLPYYVIHAANYLPQHKVLGYGGYPDYQCLYCTKGSGLLTISERSYTIPKGTGFILFPGVPYEYGPINEPWEMNEFSFGGYGIPSLFNVLGLTESTVFNISNMQFVDYLFEDIFISIQTDSNIRGYKCSAAIYRFFMELASFTGSEDLKLQANRLSLLQPIISYMEENYHQNPSLEEMASLINVSVFQLCRIFKQAYNTTPFEYIMKLRVQKGKEIITGSSSVKIKDVAQSVGYKKMSYFCSVFKKYEGITPAEFKRMHHNI